MTEKFAEMPFRALPRRLAWWSFVRPAPNNCPSTEGSTRQQGSAACSKSVGGDQPEIPTGNN